MIHGLIKRKFIVVFVERTSMAHGEGSDTHKLVTGQIFRQCAGHGSFSVGK